MGPERLRLGGGAHGQRDSGESAVSLDPRWIVGDESPRPSWRLHLGPLAGVNSRVRVAYLKGRVECGRGTVSSTRDFSRGRQCAQVHRTALASEQARLAGRRSSDAERFLKPRLWSVSRQLVRHFIALALAGPCAGTHGVAADETEKPATANSRGATADSSDGAGAAGGTLVVESETFIPPSDWNSILDPLSTFGFSKRELGEMGVIPPELRIDLIVGGALNTAGDTTLPLAEGARVTAEAGWYGVVLDSAKSLPPSTKPDPEVTWPLEVSTTREASGALQGTRVH